jgi:hypothetical protein
MGQDPLKDRASTSSEADEEWRSRTHLGIMIENIPSHWMISDLKSFFDTFGTIVKAEIFEDRQVTPIAYFPNIRPADLMVAAKWCSGTHLIKELK